MKKSILSISVVLIALFSLAALSSFEKQSFTVKTSGAHFVGKVCYDESTGYISGKVAGLGDATGYTVSLSGSYGCQNPGSNKPTAWQGLDVPSVPLTSTETPGTYTFSQSVSNFECHDNWTLILDASANLKYGSVTKDVERVSENCD